MQKAKSRRVYMATTFNVRRKGNKCVCLSISLIIFAEGNRKDKLEEMKLALGWE